MTWLFSPPSLDDLIRLLKAWRFWTLGALVGALLGTVVFYIAPPPYRAQATVLVDFNLEEAWPQEADRQQFFYLAREARKLEEIAWSDDVLQMLSSGLIIPVEGLHAGKLKLSQAADAGRHLCACEAYPEHALGIGAAWALIDVEMVRDALAKSAGLNSFIQVDATQTEYLPVDRSVSLSVYLFPGAISFLFLSSL